jgi:hypothetical protein
MGSNVEMHEGEVSCKIEMHSGECQQLKFFNYAGGVKVDTSSQKIHKPKNKKTVALAIVINLV